MQIEQVKRNLNQMVVYKGKTDVYRLVGCILRKGKDGIFYQAELQDTTCQNSVVVCKLEDIEVIENGN